MSNLKYRSITIDDIENKKNMHFGPYCPDAGEEWNHETFKKKNIKN